MQKKKVLSPRELETEKILQTVLPEYDIRANVRLVDVIHTRHQFIYMRGYQLDFVICDKEANTIAAVELDDSTHDNEDGKRRDKNKNRWMAEARIKLIRIRTPAEALNIRELMQQPDDFDRIVKKYSTPKENIYSFEKKSERASKNNVPSKLIKYIVSVIGVIAFFAIAMNLVNIGAQKTIENLGKNTLAQQQQLQQQNQQWADQQRLTLQQKTQQTTEVQEKVEAMQPHYEQRVVKGKSARECQVDGVITNASIKCMKNHYETVLVNGNQ